jgi:hypothetical protein
MSKGQQGNSEEIKNYCQPRPLAKGFVRLQIIEVVERLEVAGMLALVQLVSLTLFFDGLIKT